jgi:hypothetical protein
MDLTDGRLYTPEEICEAGALGSDTTPEALRKAARSGAIEYTRFRNRIYLTRANVLANQEAGFVPAAADQRTTPGATRRSRRSPVTAVADRPRGVKPLVAKSGSRRSKAS